MPLILPSTRGHWYQKDGTPCHEVPMVTDPSRMRDTDLRDARKMGLLPSVTTILKILDKPQLDSWREEQMVMAALTMPVIEDESLDDRAKRVVRDAQQYTDEARKRGHLLHAAVEQYLLFGKAEPADEVAALFEPFPAWADANILKVYYSEKALVGRGYAGTLDLKAEMKGYGNSICDFKSRKAYKGKFTGYDEDAMQLCAYRRIEEVGPDCPPAEHILSIFIRADEPGEPFVKEWDAESCARYTEAFLACFQLWKHLKNYNPEAS